MLREREFGGLALVEVFQGHGDTVDEVLALPWAGWSSASEETGASTPEELREEILWVHAHTTLSRRIQTRLTRSVIPASR